ncbi:MAG: hypothetical protein QNJ54_36365 [Prochloraceae cyanobacterium]|nr:hypothetical protein [Prochloraceae cyanobacterium]
MKRFSVDQVFATVATVAVICALIAGFWVIGSPGRQRLIRAARQRLKDIRSISYNLYRKAKGKEDYKLPKTWLENNLALDPLTNQPYFYKRLSDKTYQLCASFATDSSTYLLQNRPQNRKMDKWTHPQGRHCFNFDVTKKPPTLY